ncbi:phytanoyl-CoA dioxygenase family protein [Lignipirellula cremea]|uniref:Phytanoyl-CoA dioxygenase (PhyH) n=1 Tax=Lignipirellula cremea TaxID=2528010 RepID=A0A518DLX2_9BACT|nr:phytanoyl-CoA dioxygenase family protein [Lignipirellula cremea]QDU92823.1 Phytanoyl-CoA dioxygenase (PhyH) [Lignipirellula cremea]
MTPLAAAADALAPEQVAAYRETGFLLVRNLFSPEEIEALAQEADTLLGRTELVDTQNIRCRWQDHAETGECRFDCFDPVIDIGPVCRYFAHDPRLQNLLQAIYREEPRLFKDKLIFKPPGATGYALHQDYIGWKEFPQSFVTVIIPIDATSAENGATEVFPGYHQQGYLSPADGEYHQLPPETVDASTGVLLEMGPGDVALFSGFTPHRSGANQGSQARRQLYLSYNAASDGGDQRDAHYRQFHAWLVTKYAEYGKTGVYFR